jgi:hypothetical protein
LLPSLGLCALILNGCFITQGQIFVHYGLPDPILINSANDQFERIDVDLNTISEYIDNKDNIETISDLAVVGKFTNLPLGAVASPAGSLEVWITPNSTNYLTVTDVKNHGTKLWSGAISASTSTVVVDWDGSAALFNAEGKQILLDETKGDGQFTLYTFGTAGVYNIKIEDGGVIIILSGGV